MKRRRFVTNLILSGSAMCITTGCNRRIEPSSKEDSLSKSSNIESLQTITESARKIPVFTKTDVLVIGGGPAGVAASIAASRTGAETYLVERYNHLGGLWTGGLVLPLLSTHAVNKQKVRKKVLYGIGEELCHKLSDLNMSINTVNPVIDPEACKYVLDEMIREAGVKILYHSWGVNVIIEDRIIKGVFIESKSGRMAILAKVIIDCTGDGDVMYMAGEQYHKMNYFIGLVHRLGNIDRINSKHSNYKKINIGLPTPISSVNWVNMHGKDDQDGVDILTLSQLQSEYRKLIWENVEKIKQSPGYEKVFLLDTASQIGVRMSRILEGEYKLTLKDSMTHKNFEDVIGIGGASPTILYNGKRIIPAKRPMWQIPYRSLLPKKTENLLVAGRCFSFEPDLTEDARLIGPCLITGQGAGAAAGLAIKERNTVRNINIARLKKLLIEQGVWLG